jgi:ribosomal-protein-alanine N-acetyltransferase
MTTKQVTEVQIRWMIRRDMPEVLEIENQSFEFPWSEEDYISCLSQRNCIGMVAEHDERIAGVMLYELLKSKLHVLNFAVHPEFQRQGAGGAKKWQKSTDTRCTAEARAVCRSYGGRSR